MTYPSNSYRSYRARSDIEKKVQILETWADQGVPDGFTVPKSIAEFCRWKDARLDIREQKKQSLLSPRGKYNDLRIRLDRVLSRLNPKIATEEKPSKDRYFVPALLKQVIEFRAENTALLLKLSEKEAKVDELRDLLRKRGSKNVVFLPKPRR